MKTHTRVLSVLILACALASIGARNAGAAEEDFSAQLLPIQQAWDVANYSGDPQQREKELEQLSRRIETFVQQHPDRAEALVWQGIILSSYAGAKGGLGALSSAKRARACLLAALKLDETALQGSAYTSLGVLYYKVPGFPLAFGDHDQAREYLRKALALNPDGIDPNYFYGELLFEGGEYAQSLGYLQKALAAPARPDRPLADSGRRGEIEALMARVRVKLAAVDGKPVA